MSLRPLDLSIDLEGPATRLGGAGRARPAHVDAWWRACNYLTVGQIYLQANALLREPLRSEHIKPRLLGHWGTSPGLNLVYAHVNRLVPEHDATPPSPARHGRGGPAVLANVSLEGPYSYISPEATQDAGGMLRL